MDPGGANSRQPRLHQNTFSGNWCCFVVSLLKQSQLMMTPSNRNSFRVTGPLWGEFNGRRWIPLTEASDAELCGFFGLRRNKRLNKRLRRWWFETPSHLLNAWRHCNAIACWGPYQSGFCVNINGHPDTISINKTPSMHASNSHRWLSR